MSSGSPGLLDAKYRVVRILGEGGFGTVLLAEDTVVAGRRVAVKILRRTDLADQADLIAEMEALARLNHPGVVTFFHHFVQDERLHVVMEYCDRGSLRETIRQGAAKTDPAIKWVRQVAKTLEFVHGKGIVHHDIKPENLLFGSDGRLKIGDFGAANRKFGTRIYMAPELLSGAPVSTRDARVDVYSLGLTLLELVTGHHPFIDVPKDDLPGTMYRHDFVDRSLPVWLQEVILRATHPTPEVRFQTMREFDEALASRHVPYVFSGDRIKAQVLVEKAEGLSARKKWKDAERSLSQAITIAQDNLAAQCSAGRLALLLGKRLNARRHFEAALHLNPRTNIQKELGWLSLEEGDHPKAISLLNDHLQREAGDFEAYNLLLRCYYETGRYEAGVDLASLMVAEKAPSECFRNNRLLCRIMLGNADESIAEALEFRRQNPFIAFNLEVATETPASWNESTPSSLKAKLLFQEYRFGRKAASTKGNVLTVQAEGRERRFKKPIISFGRSDANDLVLRQHRVSRRHCAILNYASDVWIVDLGSNVGTTIGGNVVERTARIDGVVTVGISEAELVVTPEAGLLI